MAELQVDTGRHGRDRWGRRAAAAWRAQEHRRPACDVRPKRPCWVVWGVRGLLLGLALLAVPDTWGREPMQERRVGTGEPLEDLLSLKNNAGLRPNHAASRGHGAARTSLGWRSQAGELRAAGGGVAAAALWRLVEGGRGPVVQESPGPRPLVPRVSLVIGALLGLPIGMLRLRRGYQATERAAHRQWRAILRQAQNGLSPPAQFWDIYDRTAALRRKVEPLKTSVKGAQPPESLAQLVTAVESYCQHLEVLRATVEIATVNGHIKHFDTIMAKCQGTQPGRAVLKALSRLQRAAIQDQGRCRSPEAAQALSQLLDALEQAGRSLAEATQRTGGLEGGEVQQVVHGCPRCKALGSYRAVLHQGWLYHVCRDCGRVEPWLPGISAWPVCPGMAAMLICVCGVLFYQGFLTPYRAILTPERVFVALILLVGLLYVWFKIYAGAGLMFLATVVASEVILSWFGGPQSIAFFHDVGITMQLAVIFFSEMFALWYYYKLKVLLKEHDIRDVIADSWLGMVLGWLFLAVIIAPLWVLGIGAAVLSIILLPFGISIRDIAYPKGLISIIATGVSVGLLLIIIIWRTDKKSRKAKNKVYRTEISVRGEKQ